MSLPHSLCPAFSDGATGKQIKETLFKMESEALKGELSHTYCYGSLLNL